MVVIGFGFVMIETRAALNTDVNIFCVVFVSGAWNLVAAVVVVSIQARLFCGEQDVL